MTLNDIGKYKDIIFNTFLRSTEICEIISNAPYNEETVVDELPYKNIFPYLYVDNAQTETKSYICVEIDVPNVFDVSWKSMKIIVLVCTHKDLMKYQRTGYDGTRLDILSTAIDNVLQSSNKYGVGRLKLDSAKYTKINNMIYGRELVYSCSEFNLKGKLGNA